jgi:protein-disulfide isomerase
LSKKTLWIAFWAVLGGVCGGIAFAYMNGAFVRNVPVPDYRMTGPADAPIRIDEFTDLQCPACARGNEALDKIMSVYGPYIRLVFHHNPLPIHRWAVPAAVAAECAGRQGRFFPYAAKLYATQNDWENSPKEPENFAAYAKEMGLDANAFAACRADPSVRAIIDRDVKYATQKHIDATPTYMVNGREYQGGKELTEGAGAFEDIVRAHAK